MSSQNADNGRFVWYELLTKDPGAALAFYSKVIGWSTLAFGKGSNYVLLVAEQGPVGGAMGLPNPAATMGIPSSWTASVQVEDVDATASLAKKLGGAVRKEPEQVPGVGRFAVIADPHGARLSISRPASPMNRHDSSKRGEFCWNELLTTDHGAAFEFYSALFGWENLQDMDMGPVGTYRVFGSGENRLGGMMNLPTGASTPPMWLFYVETLSLDEAMATAVKEGATVMNGPMDVAGGGRIVQMVDPQQVAFALHQSQKK